MKSDICAECFYSAFMGKGRTQAGEEVKTYVCRRNPPTLIPLMVQGKATPGNPSGAQMVPTSAFTPCPQAPVDWCGEFTTKTSH